MSDSTYRFLADRFAATGAEIRAYEGRAQLKLFADTYPFETRLDPEQDVVYFGTLSESFEVRADRNELGHSVYSGRIVTFSPETILFDTGWQSELDTVMDALVEGATKLFRDQRTLRAKHSGAAKADVIPFKVKAMEGIASVVPNKAVKKGSKKKKGVNLATPEKCLSVLGTKLRSMMETSSNPNEAKPVLEYYMKRRSLLKARLPSDTVVALDKALSNMTEKNIIAGINSLSDHFGFST